MEKEIKLELNKKSKKPLGIIVDMDGTLCFNHGRDPYDASTADEDIPNNPVIFTVKALKEYGFKIIICTGRHVGYKNPTLLFLHKWGIFPDEIFMRKAEDGRSDARTKKEIYELEIANKYEILFVIDDWHAVVKMWREELKLTVLQPNDGYLRYIGKNGEPVDTWL